MAKPCWHSQMGCFQTHLTCDLLDLKGLPTTPLSDWAPAKNWMPGRWLFCSSRSPTMEGFIWDGLLGNEKTSGKLSIPYRNMRLENYQLALLNYGVKDT